MEQEVVVSRWVDELRHQLEFAYRESQDRAAVAMRAWATELRAVERVTTAEQGLDAAKAHLVETEVVF